MGRSPPLALLLALAVTQLANLVTTTYLHRALAHKSLVTVSGA